MEECSSELILKDDWGDDNCTFYCEKQQGHRGKHRRTYNDEWVMEWETKQEAADAK
jgi:hypothetical protein